MEKDGSKAGISVNLVPPSPEKKAQKLDLELLKGTGLEFLPDDLLNGGDKNHGVITPVDAAGQVDHRLLKEWAECRGTGRPHRFTEAILKAIETVRSKK